MTDSALEADPRPNATVLDALPPHIPTLVDSPRRRSVADLSFTARIAVVATLSLVGYAAVFWQAIADAATGSRTAVAVVIPLLMVLISTGYRRPTRGVGDAESDWIIATLVGVGSFAGIFLLAERMPTLSTLWRLQTLGFIVWFACLLMIMFGARHLVRMWTLWVFAVCCLTPLPFLLVTAALGGSDDATALLAAAVGAVAVFLASPAARLRHRLIATAGCLIAAGATVMVLDAHIGLLGAVVLGAGVVPVLAVVLLNVAAKTAVREPGAATQFPRCSLLSLVVLTVVAVTLATVNHPDPRLPEAPPVGADWAQRAGLGAATEFSFISPFLGSDAKLVRYELAGSAGRPAAAVDVMTTPSRAALDDFAAAVWYPSARPVEYRPAAPSAGFPSGTRIVHSNADAATYNDDPHWYAITWMWRTDSSYQNVTVIVSQSFDGRTKPPSPQPLSLLDTSVRPVLWTTRQQPHVDGQVDASVTRRAEELARKLVGPAPSTGAPAND